MVELFAGKSAAALRSMEASAASAGPSGSNQTGYTRVIAAAQLLALGRPAEALAQAERGLKDAKGGDAEWGCLYYLALAQSRTGRTAEAAKTIDMLTAKANAAQRSGVGGARTPGRLRWTAAIRPASLSFRPKRCSPRLWMPLSAAADLLDLVPRCWRPGVTMRALRGSN
jgi:hypothetical protein